MVIQKYIPSPLSKACFVVDIPHVMGTSSGHHQAFFIELLRFLAHSVVHTHPVLTAHPWNIVVSCREGGGGVLLHKITHRVQIFDEKNLKSTRTVQKVLSE